jgi:signal transduction histidine kinase/ActR/RegA family two-component response regulator
MSSHDMKANILLVDDRPEKVLAIEAVLSSLGENIVCASSGREALRHILNTEFAVILLDVNMPGMDGFETATLIRQRRSTQHVPIIFITVIGDEMQVVRGYSLGAVDYIMTPFVPEVLLSKVGVFVDLYRKTHQVKLQAESLARRASQLQKLAQASVIINSALSLERMLHTITQTAGDVIQSHQAITLFIDPRPGRRTRTQAFTAFSDRYANWRDKPLQLDALAHSQVLRNHSATRMTEEQVTQHPDWAIVQNLQVPPILGGMLAAPLTGRDGSRLGVIYLADGRNGPFTADDEMIAVQLAQMASIAIENAMLAEEREANRLKEEFLSTLSHELRTPLNAILGWTQLLRLQAVNGELAHGVEVIERNARAQARLIEDLLDVSRIATQKLRLNLQAVPLDKLIAEVCDSHRPAAEAKHIEWRVKVPSSCVNMNADPDRLRQVLTNLISNAIKFTPDKGQIDVSVECAAQQVRVSVTDTGCGIDRAFLPYVFERFRQADSSSTRRQGGLGIGLAIVRHIVELHGGSVRADSPGVGMGSVFAITLPLNEAETGNPVADDRPDPAAEPANIDGVRVLVLDDQADAREMLKRVLQNANADVTTAGTATEALDLVPLIRPDVIVSDIAMPDQDGYAFIRQLRSTPVGEGGQTPSIALTAYAREEDRQLAARAGFQAHVAKPVEPHVIIAAIARLAPRSRAGNRGIDRLTTPKAFF